MKARKVVAAVGLALLLTVAALVSSWIIGRPAAAQNPLAVVKGRGGEPSIVSGKLVSVKVWEHPVDAKWSTNSGSKRTGGRVDVYDRFIVITDPTGERSLYFHGYYTDLRFGSD
ncbi:MAG TPA: hypothetical protein VN641_12790 [Urbifossiella sp.]|jgi:hypothetical protein|nr:hypothetical protein [Urbifossiella sp.]